MRERRKAYNDVDYRRCSQLLLHVLHRFFGYELKRNQKLLTFNVRNFFHLSWNGMRRKEIGELFLSVLLLLPLFESAQPEMKLNAFYKFR